MLANIIGSFILVLVGWSLIVPLNEYGYPLGLVFFGVTLLISLIMMVINVKYILYSNDYDEQPEEVKKKKHKQTYLEYVQERLKVERLMKQ